MRMLLFFYFIIPGLLQANQIEPSSSGQYKVIEVKKLNPEHGLSRTETIVQFGDLEINRFRLSHLTQSTLPKKKKTALFLLPGGGSNFDIYAIKSGGGPSLAEILARQGHDVFGYSPRTGMLAPGQCEQVDCKEMLKWGVDEYVNDIMWSANYFKRNGHNQMIIGGISLGAMLSIATINRTVALGKSNFFKGAIIWEGALYSTDKKITLPLAPLCQGAKQAVEAGQFSDDSSYPLLKSIAALAENDPNGQAPQGPEGMTNLGLFIAMTTSPQDPPNGIVPGYTLLQGDLQTGLRYSELSKVFLSLDMLNSYEPMAVTRDFICALAAQETSYTNKLSGYKQAVLAISAGHGFGKYMNENLALFSHAKLTSHLVNDYAHADFITANDDSLQKNLYRPLLNWLNQLSK